MKKPDHEIAALVAPMLVAAGYTTKYWLETRWDYLMKIVSMLKVRCRRMTDFVAKSEYFFHSDFIYDSKAAEKRFTDEGRQFLVELAKKFEPMDDFRKEDVETALDEVSDRLGEKRGKLIHPTRLAVSGVSEGPGLFDILEAIGRDETVKRIRKAIEFIESKGGQYAGQDKETGG